MNKTVIGMVTISLLASCSNQVEQKETTAKPFEYVVDHFADYEILRYEVKGFDELPLQKKELIYYLNEAALWGRDMLFDQNCKINLQVKRVLEQLYTTYKGDKNEAEFKNFVEYLKLVWIGNGIHHHYSSDKYKPLFSVGFFDKMVSETDLSMIGADVDAVKKAIFDEKSFPKRVNQADGEDLLLTSSMNYYDGVTQDEAEKFYDKMKDPKDNTPPSYGLNSRLVKRDGKVYEEVCKVGGRFSESLEKVVYWLEKAAGAAENDKQRDVIASLMEYYKTGDLRQFDQYTIKWVNDLDSQVDFVNGFTETYGDPLGQKASWESIVNFKDLEATKRTEIISTNAQWFEDNSPTEKRFKKEEVKGVSAKVIVAAILGGDCYPSTPIGINLPNSNWVRRDHGSKSVTISNITDAYDKASQGSGFNEEFMLGETELSRSKQFGVVTSSLHTDLHECLGHGSGKLLPGVDPDALKAYSAPIEETRADLFALYYMGDKKMVELDLLPEEAYKAEYYKYIMNGAMTQLIRIQPGKNIEQAHMRNRATISRWMLEKGKEEKIVEMVDRAGKTYIVVNDYEKLRGLFGQLLKEVQEIKSTGNFEAAKKMIETYGVKVDPALHNQILSRYAKLNLAPYRGFVNPVYKATMGADGKVTDVQIDYSENYVDQHLRYAKEYSSLPIQKQ